MKVTRRDVSRECDLPDSVHPVLQRVFAARNISSTRELDYTLGNLLPFTSLKDIDRAAQLLVKAIRDNKRILIVADYDADGATACAVGLRGLALLGARHTDYLVPDREKHGYGLSSDVAALALERKPDLLVTVDNGISSLAGVELARKAGVEVLITDHHLPGKALPAASAIVNPNQPGDTFPSKHIAGVGVMFYVLLAVRARLKDADWFARQGRATPNFATLLDLVALGTIADVVQLDLNNRILVEQGLQRIRSERCCPGILALCQVAGRDPARLTTADLGFMLGPRLNAAGRLEDMGQGIECLLADDDDQARALAQELDDLNRARRQIQADMQEQADVYLEQILTPQRDETSFGLCLYDPGWHQGVVGILAGRIKETLNRPVIIFAGAGDGLIKGSGRSISGIHLRDALEALATQHPNLLQRYGGHAMAAGLSINAGDYEQFRELFDAEIMRLMGGRLPGAEVATDGTLAPADFNLELAGEIEQAGPWGQGFPEPLFDGVFSVAGARLVGEKHLKLTLLPEHGQRAVNAISFNTDESAISNPDQTRLVYQLSVNRYNGYESPQLIIRHIL